MLRTMPHSPLAPSAPFSITRLLQPPLLSVMPPLVGPVNIPHPFVNAGAAAAVSRNIIENAVISTIHQSRRPRSEKKPIPDEQKDEKYYERRKRNNKAAKKSRDARKIREDHIALRASMLEHENAILRAQIMTLREECQSLRQMLIKQRMPLMQSVDQLIGCGVDVGLLGIEDAGVPTKTSPPQRTPAANVLQWKPQDGDDTSSPRGPYILL